MQYCTNFSHHGITNPHNSASSFHEDVGDWSPKIYWVAYYRYFD